MTESTIIKIDSDRAGYQNIGLFLGPAIFLVMLALSNYQQTMSMEAWRTAAVGLWMAVWWATEAIPVPATAFLPIVTFDILGIASVKEAAAPMPTLPFTCFLGHLFWHWPSSAGIYISALRLIFWPARVPMVNA